MVMVSELPAFREFVRQLGTETEMMDFMGHGVPLLLREIAHIDIVVEIMEVHKTICDAAAGSDVEVANDFVDTENTLNATAFFALGIKTLTIPFLRALLDIFSFLKGPRVLGISITHFFTRIATPWFTGIGRGWRSTAFAAIVWVQVFDIARLMASVISNHWTSAKEKEGAQFDQ